MKGSTFGLGLKYFKTASSPFSVCRVEAFQDSDDSKLVRSHLTCWILPLMIARLAVGITVGGGRGRCDHHSGILPFGMLLALRGRGYGVIIAVVTRLIFQTPRGGGGGGVRVWSSKWAFTTNDFLVPMFSGLHRSYGRQMNLFYRPKMSFPTLF